MRGSPEDSEPARCVGAGRVAIRLLESPCLLHGHGRCGFHRSRCSFPILAHTAIVPVSGKYTDAYEECDRNGDPLYINVSYFLRQLLF